VPQFSQSPISATGANNFAKILEDLDSFQIAFGSGLQETD